MPMHWQLILIANAILALSTERIAGAFFEKRRTSTPIYMLTIFLNFAIPSLLITLPDAMVLRFFVGMFTFFIVTLNYDTLMMRRIIASAYSVILFAVMEISLYFITHLLPDALRESAAVEILSAPVMSLIVILFFRWRIKHIKNERVTPPLFFASSMLVVFLSGIIAVLLLSVGDAIPQEIAVTISVALYIMNVVTIFICDALAKTYENRLVAERKGREKEYYLTQCQMMQESTEKAKAFRHDMSNHLAVLQSYALKEQHQAADEYLNSLRGQLGESQIYSDTGNLTFDSIINYKLRNAGESHIKLDIEMLIPPILSVDAVDIVTILGNLLDNALDAVAKVEDKWIRLDVRFDKGTLFIEVDNSYNGKLHLKHGVMRTLKDGAEHGLGLKNIEQSVDKYNGYMELTHTDTTFSVGILLYIGDTPEVETE